MSLRVETCLTARCLTSVADGFFYQQIHFGIEVRSWFVHSPARSVILKRLHFLYPLFLAWSSIMKPDRHFFHTRPGCEFPQINSPRRKELSDFHRNTSTHARAMSQLASSGGPTEAAKLSRYIVPARGTFQPRSPVHAEARLPLMSLFNRSARGHSVSVRMTEAAFYQPKVKVWTVAGYMFAKLVCRSKCSLPLVS